MKLDDWKVKAALALALSLSVPDVKPVEPTPVVIPTRPAGEGWQWDTVGGFWWKKVDLVSSVMLPSAEPFVASRQVVFPVMQQAPVVYACPPGRTFSGGT